MYGGISHKLSMLRKKSASEDVTPDEFIFSADNGTPTFVYCDADTNDSATFFEGRVTGINNQITLRLRLPDNTQNYRIVNWIYYRVAQTSGGFLNSGRVESGTYSYQAFVNNDGVFLTDIDLGALSSGLTLNVNNNDYVGFAIVNGGASAITYELRNISDNNTLLDGMEVIDISF